MKFDKYYLYQRRNRLSRWVLGVNVFGQVYFKDSDGWTKSDRYIDSLRSTAHSIIELVENEVEMMDMNI